MASLFEGAVDAYQNGLGVGSALAPVAVAVFANDHGWANRSLGMVVVERNLGMIEKGEQIALVAPEALHQSPRLGVFPGRLDQIGQPRVKPLAPRGKVQCFAIGLAAQANGVPHQPPEFLGESGPFWSRTLVLLDVLQIAQQVHQARLPSPAGDRVVRAPKVADQRPPNSC